MFTSVKRLLSCWERGSRSGVHTFNLPPAQKTTPPPRNECALLLNFFGVVHVRACRASARPCSQNDSDRVMCCWCHSRYCPENWPQSWYPNSAREGGRWCQTLGLKTRQGWIQGGSDKTTVLAGSEAVPKQEKRQKGDGWGNAPACQAQAHQRTTPRRHGGVRRVRVAGVGGAMRADRAGGTASASPVYSTSWFNKTSRSRGGVRGVRGVRGEGGGRGATHQNWTKCTLVVVSPKRLGNGK